jgi:hypothetical protein
MSVPSDDSTLPLEPIPSLAVAFDEFRMITSPRVVIGSEKPADGVSHVRAAAAPLAVSTFPALPADSFADVFEPVPWTRSPAASKMASVATVVEDVPTPGTPV